MWSATVADSYAFNTAQVVSKVSIIRRRNTIFVIAFKDMNLYVSQFFNLERFIPAGFIVAKGSIFLKSVLAHIEVLNFF